MTASRSNSSWLAAICVAELATMMLFSSFNAMVPTLQREWELSDAEVGFILSAYQLGNACAVVVFSTFTDWVGPRRVYVIGALWAAAAGIAFSTADGFVSALIWRTLAGIGLAGTYMPGLRLVAERFQRERRGFAVGWYTAVFVFGTSVSLFVTSWSTALWGWRLASIVAAVCPILAAAIAIVVFDDPAHYKAPTAGNSQSALKPILQNHQALRLIGAYGAHTWELMGMRGWILPFLVVAAQMNNDDSGYVLKQASVLASLILAVGAIPQPFAGSQSDRWGRRRVISAIMVASALCSLAMGWMLTLPFAVIAVVGLIYGLTVTAESPILSTAITEVTDQAYLGRAMALQSAVGFGMGAAAPAVVGVVLGAAKTWGATSVQAWGIGFSVLGLVALLGPIFLGLGSRGPEDVQSTHAERRRLTN
jgi:MFS family permease